jgi:hypothetical protein
MLRLLVGHLYFRFQHLLARPSKPAAPPASSTRFIVTTGSQNHVRIHDTHTNLSWIERCELLAPTDSTETISAYDSRQPRRYIPEALISESVFNNRKFPAS